MPAGALSGSSQPQPAPPYVIPVFNLETGETSRLQYLFQLLSVKTKIV
jgi:hypothetical protein